MATLSCDVIQIKYIICYDSKYTVQNSAYESKFSVQNSEYESKFVKKNTSYTNKFTNYTADTPCEN